MKLRKSPRAVLPVLALCLAAAAAMLVSPAASGQGGRRAAQDIEQSLERFDSLALDPAEALRGARAAGRVRLATSRGDFDLEVEPFDVRGENYRAVAVGEGGVVTELPRAPSNSWRGRVAGTKGSFVRLVLDGRSIQGIIITPAGNFFVEPARALSASAAAGEHVFYAESDVKPTEGECGVTLGSKVAERAARLRPESGAASAAAATTDGAPTPEEMFAPMPQADVALEADFEFFQKSSNNQTTAENDMRAVMTQVDGIYEAQLGISLRVVFVRVWATAADPYTPTDAGNALTEFAQVYEGTFGGAAVPARDLTHMFTGKEFDGSTIGIAFGGVVCDAGFLSYGISESKFNDSNPQATPFAQRVGVTAHEIGHNFGASHPNQESPVPPDCAGTIMNSSVTASPTQFCQFSRDQITSLVTGVSTQCLDRLTQGGCNYAITPTSTSFNVGGGGGVVNVSTAGGCAWGVAEGAPWVTFTAEAGAGPGATSYSVAPNTGKDGPRRAFVDIGGQRFAILQQSSPACLASATDIPLNQTLSGALAASDCIAAQPGRLTAFEDLYTLVGRAGQRVRITMSETGTTNADSIDTYLYLFGPDGSLVAENDDIVLGSNTNSSIPVSGFVTLPQTGVYTIAATTFDNSSAGPYTIRVSDNSAAASFSLSSASYGVDEALGAGGLGSDGLGFRVVTVNRSGDTSGTATVDYATSDGTASGRSDYTQTLGTLVFGPGETSKSFNVFVDDDTFAEGAETINVTLSNPVGAGLSVAAGTITINSNDGATGPSPVRAESFNSSFFVRQHYLDFLTREPDAGGMQFWTGNIEECGADAQCREARRINVSGAFFLSIEFQETGYLAYRTFKAAYGDATSPGVPGTVPSIRLSEFLADSRRIGEGVVVGPGNWQSRLDANKNDYMAEFVLRPRFLAAFPVSMTAAEFVDKLNQNAGGVLSQAERDALVAQLEATPNQSAGRASVLRQVAEDADLKVNEKNRAFVLMQYFGYLRRNPDDAPEPGLNYGGWNFWLGKLNEFNGDFVTAEMVKAFITSDEYINRFGQ